jgi:hypothetical protein
MISNQVCLAKIENRKARRAPIYQHLSDEYHFCLGGGGSSFWRVSTVGDLVACSGRLLVVGGLLRVAVSGSSCGMPAAAFFRASTTRRTMTAQGSVKVHVYTQSEQHTRKGLLNIHHLPCARLHESKIMLPAPL